MFEIESSSSRYYTERAEVPAKPKNWESRLIGMINFLGKRNEEIGLYRQTLNSVYLKTDYPSADRVNTKEKNVIIFWFYK